MKINELVIKLNYNLFEIEYDSTFCNKPKPSVLDLKRKFPILKEKGIKEIYINEEEKKLEITFDNKLTHSVNFDIIDITKQGI